MVVIKATLAIILFSIVSQIDDVECKRINSKTKDYLPTWESLDKRPIPQWYDDIKFGIFIHWGVYSVPGFGSEWFWINWKSNSTNYVEFMNKTYPPGYSYQQFAPDFTAQFFDADEWADIIHKSNAKYVVLTSKHHEGFTMWPSQRAFSWNSVDVGPHRDIVGELSRAVRNKKMKFGLYYSLYEWFNPMYVDDKESDFETRTYVEQKMWPELKELVHNYEPDVIWSDGDWEPKDTYWKSTEFLAWLYNESPIKDTVVVNDRWGSGIPCNHGDFYTCTDRYNPGVLQPHKWENCMTIDKKSWGYRRNAVLSDYKTVHELIEELVTTVSCGGNLLMNVGPTHDGVIAPIFQDRLHGLGEWLDVNGEGIFETVPWVYQNDTLNGKVWYTSSKSINEVNANEKIVYAISLEWPQYNLLPLGALVERLSEDSKIYMLGNKGTLKWKEVENRILIEFPDKATTKSELSWTLKITNVVT